MDSPLEVILGLGASGGVVYGIVTRILEVRNKAASSNAHLADMKAKVAASRVRQAVAEALEAELRATGLSLLAIRMREMQKLAKDVTTVLQEIGTVEIEE